MRALGSGGADAWRDTAASADARYVDGIALTIGAPRRHVFAFVQGLGDAFGPGLLGSECPCSGGPQAPSFVASAYVCEEPRLSVDGTGRFYDNSDVLFDGLDVDEVSCQGSIESAPDFQASVGAATIEDLQLHVMMSQGPGDEDLAIISADLWIR
ncbi:MAG: hypothetical protein IT383_27785 [Deltaproteobacteria bacterium]|nr:hypothetical protein [Deltaproteobacteria bacterium]